MSVRELETDYLIAGTGAMGMAFADTLLEETDAEVILVDMHHKPGGHWNDAYPFVTLHQPSAFYGVSSLELSKGRRDTVGLNRGLNDLASGAEVSAYFDEVMRHHFLPSGRVQYFPQCEVTGSGTFHSLLTGQEYLVKVRKKTIDATYLKTSVPSTHTPSFAIDEEVQFMPLNELPGVSEAPDGFVVLGGGKTGIDACLWLLENGVDPASIRWIMPRDAWLLDRRNAQPTDDFFEYTVGSLADQFEAIAASQSVSDLFERLEASGVLLRIDTSVKPKMFHGASVSQPELDELRRIADAGGIVRMGRVEHLGAEEIVLEEGTLPTSPGHLHVDCTARAIPNLETKPIFAGEVITPQTVRSYQPVFSAAFIAYVEANFDSEPLKNQICGVVPLPNHDTDWIRMMAAVMQNTFVWTKHPGVQEFLKTNRLNSVSHMMDRIAEDDASKLAIMRRMRSQIRPAASQIQVLMAELAAAEG